MIRKDAWNDFFLSSFYIYMFYFLCIYIYIYICLFIYIFVYIYICLFCDLVVIHQCVVSSTSAGNFRAFFFSFLSFFFFFFLQSTANLTAPWSEKILGMISFFFSFFTYQGQIYGPGCDLSWSAESSKGQRYRNPYYMQENTC